MNLLFSLVFPLSCCSPVFGAAGVYPISAVWCHKTGGILTPPFSSFVLPGLSSGRILRRITGKVERTATRAFTKSWSRFCCAEWRRMWRNLCQPKWSRSSGWKCLLCRSSITSESLNKFLGVPVEKGTSFCGPWQCAAVFCAHCGLQSAMWHHHLQYWELPRRKMKTGSWYLSFWKMFLQSVAVQLGSFARQRLCLLWGSDNMHKVGMLFNIKLC